MMCNKQNASRLGKPVAESGCAEYQQPAAAAIATAAMPHGRVASSVLRCQARGTCGTVRNVVQMLPTNSR